MIDRLCVHPVIVLHMLRCMTDQAHYSDKYGCDEIRHTQKQHQHNKYNTRSFKPEPILAYSKRKKLPLKYIL